MQYYTFELDDESKNLCAICTPFGDYRYNRLPMGVNQSPDIAQEVMEDLFRSFDEVDFYFDDVGVFSPTWEAHCQSLTCILVSESKEDRARVKSMSDSTDVLPFSRSGVSTKKVPRAVPMPMDGGERSVV
jgi:hypothetical protein